MRPLGLSWLASPPFGGGVSAAGDCQASATLQAVCEKTTLAFGAVGSTAECQAQGQRIVSAAGTVSSGSSAGASAVVDYRPGAVVTATSGAVVTSQVEFSGAVDSSAGALVVADALRTVRAGVRPLAAASVDADPQVFVLAYTSPASARARLEATTGKFAWVSASAGAVCQAGATSIRAGYGEVVCGTALSTAARVDSNASGAIGGVATHVIDPFIQRGSVKLFDGNVESTGVASLSVEPYVYSVCLAVGRATLVGAPQAWRRADAQVTAMAGVLVDSQIVIPETGVIGVGGTAVCGASATVVFRGRANASATANPAGGALLTVRPAAQVHGAAGLTLGGTVVGIRARVDAIGAVPATCERTVGANVYLLAVASANAANQVNDITRAPPWRTTALAPYEADVVVPAAERTVTYLGTGRSMAA